MNEFKKEPSKAQKTKDAFAVWYHESNPSPDEILDKAFELIKEGLVNAAINCSLEGDMNQIYLNSLLQEADWDNEEEVSAQDAANRLPEYLSEPVGVDDYHQYWIWVYKTLKAAQDNGEGSTALDFLHGDIVPCEAFENTFTVDSILSQIK